jgi:hypothetical protein
LIVSLVASGATLATDRVDAVRIFFPFQAAIISRLQDIR